jgi:hypothetical protein
MSHQIKATGTVFEVITMEPNDGFVVTTTKVFESLFKALEYTKQQIKQGA